MMMMMIKACFCLVQKLENKTNDAFVHIYVTFLNDFHVKKSNS